MAAITSTRNQRYAIALARKDFQRGAISHSSYIHPATAVTPLIALAFLADVADVRRFRTLRKMNAYLGLVPRASNSGGKSRPGHITRESRKLTRTILTQCVHHVAASSESLDRFYRELRDKRGTGRARIAVIRKLRGMMRRMLLGGEQYRWGEAHAATMRERKY